jgi:hypothetical protein
MSSHAESITHCVVVGSMSMSGRNERMRMDAVLTSSSLVMRPHKQVATPMAQDYGDVYLCLEEVKTACSRRRQ